MDGPVHAESIRTSRVSCGWVVLVDRVVAVRIRLLERLRRGISTNRKHIASDRHPKRREQGNVMRPFGISPRDRVVNQESIQPFGAYPFGLVRCHIVSISPNGLVPKFRISYYFLFNEELVSSCIKFELSTPGTMELPSVNKK